MPVTFKHATLENGLTIIAEVDPEAHTAAMGVFVKTGARDENSELMGVSHFLEHMMFKGTARRTADEVNQHFDDIGANYNAFTSHEMTAFWAHVLPEHLDEAEDILADILRPALRPEDFDQEKSVILEEIAMYDDHPYWVLFERSLEAYYPSHPMRHRVLGTRETIAALTRDEMQEYFDERYSADNTVVALAGDFDFDAHVQSLSRRCGAWRPTATHRLYPPADRREGEASFVSDRVAQHYLMMMSPAPPMQNDDRYAAAILANIFGDTDGSRLYWSLIETGLAEEAQASYEARDGLGEFYIYASCAPANSTEVERIVRDEIARFRDSITHDDLVRVRSKVATAATLAGERPAGRMRRLGHVWTYTGEYRPLEEELERINAVTIDQLHRVLEAYPIAPKLTAHLHGSSND